ncbi:hypothetical protein [Pseudonocardia spirodelae]|uniref:Acetyltransferase n=1 Tax=Pseudonocardia spirodelae TaxID=3133431 RepID=A0ABU8T3G2_9PSEU
MKLRSRRSRTLVAAVAVLLPGRLRRAAHTRLLGYRLHPAAVIGRAFVDVGELEMDEHARIGGLTVLRGCRLVRMGPEATIGSLNLITGVRAESTAFETPGRDPSLVMERGSLITYMHVLDLSDRLTLEEFGIIAGFLSLVQTHAMNTETLRQSSSPVVVRRYGMVTSRCVLLPGADVPEASIVAAGGVVTGALKDASRCTVLPDGPSWASRLAKQSSVPSASASHQEFAPSAVVNPGPTRTTQKPGVVKLA